METKGFTIHNIIKYVSFVIYIQFVNLLTFSIMKTDRYISSFKN